MLKCGIGWDFIDKCVVCYDINWNMDGECISNVVFLVFENFYSGFFVSIFIFFCGWRRFCEVYGRGSGMYYENCRYFGFDLILMWLSSWCFLFLILML